MAFQEDGRRDSPLRHKSDIKSLARAPDFVRYIELQDSFSLDGYDKIREWRSIKKDVARQAALLRGLWRGKLRDKSVFNDDQQISADSYKKYGKRLNLAGIVRLDTFIPLSLFTLLFFCVAAFYLVWITSVTSDGRLLFPWLSSFADGADAHHAVAAALVAFLITLPFYAIIIFMTLHDTKKRWERRAGDVIREIADFQKAYITNSWAKDCRNAREMFNYGEGRSKPQVSANNAYYAVSIWRRLERFIDVSLGQYAYFIEEQIEQRQFTSLGAGIFYCAGLVAYGVFLWSRLSAGDLSYEIALSMMEMFATFWVLSLLLLIALRQRLKTMAQDIEIGIANVLSGATGAASQTRALSKGVSPLEADIADLDPFEVLIARYRQALEGDGS